jgi:hypothetical protein
VPVPQGPHLLSDLVLSSPILSEDRGIPPGAMVDAAGPSGSAGTNNFEFGVDPSLDPELAMVRLLCFRLVDSDLIMFVGIAYVNGG